MLCTAIAGSVNYYVGGNGEMLTNTWVGSYWVGADGKWIPNYDPDVNANWVKSGNTWYYQRPDGSKLTNSWKRINGSWYYFGADGAMTTGWKYVDGYKFYFGTDGKMVQDVDKLIGKQSSYRITVNRVKCQVTVYAANETGNYCIPVKTFTCSVGKAGTPTHAGTYATLKKQNPVELMGPSWGKYGTQINNYGDWFHSVACSNPDPTYALAAGNYNMLGQPASHGCVRLCVRDANGSMIIVVCTQELIFRIPSTHRLTKHRRLRFRQVRTGILRMQMQKDKYIEQIRRSLLICFSLYYISIIDPVDQFDLREQRAKVRACTSP